MIAAKAYYTAQELADLSLPGMPTSERGIQLKAKSESWEFQKRQADAAAADAAALTETGGTHHG